MTRTPHQTDKQQPHNMADAEDNAFTYVLGVGRGLWDTIPHGWSFSVLWVPACKHAVFARIWSHPKGVLDPSCSWRVATSRDYRVQLVAVAESSDARRIALRSGGGARVAGECGGMAVLYIYDASALGVETPGFVFVDEPWPVSPAMTVIQDVYMALAIACRVTWLRVCRWFRNRFFGEYK